MPAYQRLFDPPSQDDLEYLPDPLGRLDMGSYVEKPADIPDPGWDAARGDWMDGAPLGRIFGDRLFELQSGVGAGQANRRGDVFKLQALLHREGVLDAAATEGPTGYWGGRDDYALRKFQKDNGLAIDGYALPDGETIETIKGFYTPPASLRIRTMEKRGGYPEPQLRPIGLGSDRPMKPTLLSSDRGTQQEAQADTGLRADVPAGTRQDVPLVNIRADREKAIIDDTPARFGIADNPDADGTAPIWRQPWRGHEAIDTYGKLIEREAERQKVDPDLIKAILYYENADGHKGGFDALADMVGLSRSQRPMSIRADVWHSLGLPKDKATDPETNIRASVTLVKRIIERLDDPSPEKIGTLWNSLAQEKVSKRGARIGRLYRDKPWLTPLPPPTVGTDFP
ncbi:MAG: peptidoglycan-binding protein [Ferrovibrio sp.]|uniref:peptidoglycan-binding protein n=1 Tax=Ferrovibrio sp. TaxID=1917215 RepID=UPI00391AE9F3